MQYRDMNKIFCSYIEEIFKNYSKGKKYDEMFQDIYDKIQEKKNLPKFYV